MRDPIMLWDKFRTKTGSESEALTKEVFVSMGVETGRQDSIPKRERMFEMYWC